VGGLTQNSNGYPGVEEFTVEIDRYAIADGSRCSFKLPFTTDLIRLRPTPGPSAIPPLDFYHYSSRVGIDCRHRIDRS